MIMKMPSIDWSEQFEYIAEEEESLSDFDDEPDFSEYMWMEHEEEFDKNEMQRLEEEDIMKECIEAMLEDELEEQYEFHKSRSDESFPAITLTECKIENSLLNPMATEFIPQNRIIDLSPI